MNKYVCDVCNSSFIITLAVTKCVICGSSKIEAKTLSYEEREDLIEVLSEM